jgi:hypothetical protein
MKSTKLRSFLTFAALALAGLPAQAVIIATDNFNSYTAGTSLSGGTGGSGWNGTGWVTSSLGGATVMVESNGGSNAAEFTVGTESSLINFAYRQLSSSYSGDVVFVSYTLEMGQTPSADFFTLWVDNTSSTSNSHATNRLNTGLLNTTDDLFGRLNATTVVNGPSVVSGDTYQLVVQYSKSVSGAAQLYNTMSFWVNPTNGDLGTPIGTITASTLSSFEYIGFRGALNESGDTYWVDNITVATTWGDVVPVPEPSTSVLLTGALTVALTLRRRRRS